jgi:FAD/FMN-containing dehydrogenase
LADFIDQIPGIVNDADPRATTWLFGHAADGNVHVNITGVGSDDLTVDDRVLVFAAGLGGSISAEHGIGRLKAAELAARADPAELSVMRAVKHALDPKGILNPGKVLS